MAKSQSIGRCALCDKNFAKNSMTKHLQSCREKNFVSKKRSREHEVLHLAVNASDLSDYWLHLYASAEATLSDLDLLLRGVWCECCGHMSEFRTTGRRNPTRYVSHSDSEIGGWFFNLEQNDEQSMDVPLGDALPSQTTLEYTYDFGSSTELTIRCADRFQMKFQKNEIRIVARNEPPDFRCVECGNVAIFVCTECSWEGPAWFCAGCLANHECGDEMALPVVNSPRIGVCAYNGSE